MHHTDTKPTGRIRFSLLGGHQVLEEEWVRTHQGALSWLPARPETAEIVLAAASPVLTQVAAALAIPEAGTFDATEHTAEAPGGAQDEDGSNLPFEPGVEDLRLRDALLAGAEL